ncbi:MAG: hypothetical protein HGA45_36025 [Chloroflexales bacterium]|nr:hypothetical protein [Chloroflexales bacterium]
MPKIRTKFVCQQCGYASPRWSGQCPQCSQWNTLVETIEERGGAASSAAQCSISPARISAISRGSLTMPRWNS